MGITAIFARCSPYCVNLLTAATRSRTERGLLDSQLLAAASVGDASGCMDFVAQRPSGTAARRSLLAAAERGDAKCSSLLIPIASKFALVEFLSRAANVGSVECVRLMISQALRKEDYSKALLHAAKNGHFECAKILIPFSDPLASNSIALINAALNGHAECVKLLIPVSDPLSNDCAALVSASTNGKAECVKLLLPVSGPSSQKSIALVEAAAGGHYDCVKLLIPEADPTYSYSKALCLAAAHGHAECVKLLAPVSDPKAVGITALSWAAEEGHGDCVKILLAASSGTLSANHAPVFTAIRHGRADMLAIMLDHEPGLAATLDLPSIHAGAVLEGHKDIAAMLGRLIEREAIASAAGSSGDTAPRASRRL